MNNFINGIIECLSYFVSIPLIDWFGRRSTTGSVLKKACFFKNEKSVKKNHFFANFFLTVKSYDDVPGFHLAFPLHAHRSN